MDKGQKSYKSRIILLIILSVVFFIFATFRVFGYQVINGQNYLLQAEKNTSTTITVSAARGEIVDRNGIPFTKNKAIFNLEFDYSFINKGEENKLIYNLIKLFESIEEEWIDNLPITLTQPYKFIEGKDTEVTRLKNKLELNEYATAQNCIDALYEVNDYKYKNELKELDNKTGYEYQPFTEDYKRKISGVRYEMIEKDFSRYTPRYTFAQDIKPTTSALIQELSTSFPGVFIVEKSIRSYVSGNVASHIIGSMGPIYAEEYDEYKEKGYSLNAIIGKSGIEKSLENELQGKDGTIRVIKNSLGDIIEIEEVAAPIAGKTVKLTLDLEFQKELQKLLLEYIQNFNKTNNKKKKVEKASLVVMDTKTGGVLASISYPYYDINDYSSKYSEILNEPGNPLNNYALNGLYRPGSSFKPVVASAALSENVINKDTKTYCDGVYHYYSWKPGCLSIGHYKQSLSLIPALKYSCNVFFYDAGRILGIDKMNEYAKYFGLGVDTGVEIPSAKGRLTSKAVSEQYGAPWEEGNVIQAAIGQLDTAVTPLQMAVQAMTLANQGVRYSAHFVDSLLSYDQQEVISKTQTKILSQFDFSDENYKLVVDGMIEASKTVSAPNSLTNLGYQVAIKTGTPQVSPTKFNNCFVSFAPVNNPEIAVSLMLDDGDNSAAFLRRVLLAYEDTKK